MSRRRRRIVRDRIPLPLPLHVDVMVTPEKAARNVELERLAWRDIWDETKEAT